MSKGFLWFCQNNTETDYAKLSMELARSIKKHNRENNICVVVDQNTKLDSEYIDKVLILSKDECAESSQKFANEHKAFRLSPFTHTIKLEADMLFTSNTDWWWNHLCQHDLIFSVDCFNYKDEIVQETPYRKLFRENLYLQPAAQTGFAWFRGQPESPARSPSLKRRTSYLSATVTQNQRFDLSHTPVPIIKTNVTPIKIK